MNEVTNLITLPNEQDKEELLSELELSETMMIAIALRHEQKMNYQQIGDTLGVSRSTAHRILNRPACQEALRNLTKAKLAYATTDALYALVTLMNGARSEKVRLDAAIAVLDRGGVTVDTSKSVAIIGEQVAVNISL